MFAGICVGGWDRGVGEVVVFSMGTRLLTAVKEPDEKMLNKHAGFGFSRHLDLTKNRISEESQVSCKKVKYTYLP